MGDPDIPSHATSFSDSLPPGFRFFPSEQQLISYYLASKNGGANTANSEINVIKEIELYNFEPFDLPESAGFPFGIGGRKRHWYFYVGMNLNARGRRMTARGFWKQRKKARDVVDPGAGKVVVGTRKSFVFYLRDSPKNAGRTPWVMYEYSPIGHHHADHAGSFVLCRIFSKSHTPNTLSEHILSSCGEGSIATMRHVRVQRDANVRPVNDANTLEKNSRDEKNKVSNIPIGQCSVDGCLRCKPVYDQDPIDEEDYIELDDLLTPLPGVD